MSILRVHTGRCEVFNVNITGNGVANPFNGKQQFSIGIKLAKENKIIQEVKDFWEEEKTSKSSKFPENTFKTEYVRDENNADTEQETGRVIIYAKSYVEQKSGAKKKIQIQDGIGEIITDTEKLLIGNGSIANVSVAFSVYKSNNKEGLSIYLNSVQLIKLNQGHSDVFEAVQDVEDVFTYDSTLYNF